MHSNVPVRKEAARAAPKKQEAIDVGPDNINTTEYSRARCGARAGTCCVAAPGVGVPAGCGRVSTQVQRVDGRDWWAGVVKK